MARVVLSAVFLLSGLAASHAQTANCYPRIGAYSGQYEGLCSTPNVKWTAIENTIGAYGRNCRDEVWTYNRTEKMFYNHRTNEKFAMSDCFEPTPEQLQGNTSAGSSTIGTFHDGGVRGATPARR